MAKVLFKRLDASPESYILGETHAEVAELPKLACEIASKVGHQHVILLLDQNMHWPEGTILGSEMCRLLREQSFLGFICMRSANDSEEEVTMMLAAGANAVAPKCLSPKAAIQAIRSTYEQWVDAL